METKLILSYSGECDGDFYPPEELTLILGENQVQIIQDLLEVIVTYKLDKVAYYDSLTLDTHACAFIEEGFSLPDTLSLSDLNYLEISQLGWLFVHIPSACRNFYLEYTTKVAELVAAAEVTQ